MSSTPLSRGCSYSPTESIEYTALQFAARRGSVEQIQYLIESGTDLDTGPDPALHLALHKRNTVIANLLLQAGADFELKDSVNNPTKISFYNYLDFSVVAWRLSDSYRLHIRPSGRCPHIMFLGV